MYVIPPPASFEGARSGNSAVAPTPWMRTSGIPVIRSPISVTNLATLGAAKWVRSASTDSHSSTAMNSPSASTDSKKP